MISTLCMALTLVSHRASGTTVAAFVARASRLRLASSDLPGMGRSRAAWELPLLWPLPPLLETWTFCPGLGSGAF